MVLLKFSQLEIHGWSTIASLLGPGLLSGTMSGLRTVIDHIKAAIHVGKDAIQPTDPLYMLRCFCRNEAKTTFFWGVVVGAMLTWGGPVINVCTW